MADNNSKPASSRAWNGAAMKIGTSAGVSVFAAKVISILLLTAAVAVTSGCAGYCGYGTRSLAEPEKFISHLDDVSFLTFGGTLGGQYSTVNDFSMEGYVAGNVGLTGFETGDIFFEEVQFGMKFYPIQGNVRPYAGAGAVMGFYMESTSDIDTSFDFGVGALGSIGVELGKQDAVMLGIDYSYLLNSASQYGGGQLTLSLIIFSK
jgi:hypothetical protein